MLLLSNKQLNLLTLQGQYAAVLSGIQDDGAVKIETDQGIQFLYQGQLPPQHGGKTRHRAMKKLWLDIGNTRLKYWITEHDQIIEQAAELHLQSPADLLLGLNPAFSKRWACIR